jgi:hypothetical protein
VIMTPDSSRVSQMPCGTQRAPEKPGIIFL